MSLWNEIVAYYKMTGERYHVNPVIFLGIHIVATPLFAVCAWWIIHNKKKKKQILLPSLAAIFIFNAASIYLIVAGRNISFYIYLIVGLSAIVSGYFSYIKVKKRIDRIG